MTEASSQIKKIARIALKGSLLLILIPCLAELAASFFLPKPTIHKLPMVKFIADPACGYRLQPDQKAYTLGSLATINRWGFRGRDWTIEKPNGVVRVAVLGSSYAFGHGVGDEEMYSAQLERILNQRPSSDGTRYEVMSFGLGGYDTGHEISVLKAYALKFRPDVVVLSFFFNDMFYIKDYGFYEKMFNEQEVHFSRFQWEIRNFMRHSRLLMRLWDNFKDRKGAHEPGEVGAAVDAYVREGVMPPAGPQGEGWRLITERLREFKELSLLHGFKPLLMIIPTHQEMLEKNLNVSYVPYLQKIGSEIGINPIVVLNELRKSAKDLNAYLIPYDFHLSAAGHQFLAQLLTGEIFKEGRNS